MSSGKILVVGDVMLDEYIVQMPDGSVRYNHLPGGAAHVADYLKRELLREVELFTLTDRGGKTHSRDDIREVLTNLLSEIPIHSLAKSPKDARATPLKVRRVSPQKVDINPLVFNGHEDLAAGCEYIDYDHQKIADAISKKPDAVIISDYNKGTSRLANLTQTIIKLCRRLGVPVLVDLPTRHVYTTYYLRKYRRANYLQMNAIAEQNLEIPAERLLVKAAASATIVTRGEMGATLHWVDRRRWLVWRSSLQTRNLRYPHVFSSDVKNVVGAGDVVIANAAHEYAQRKRWLPACSLAIMRASQWVTKPRGNYFVVSNNGRNLDDGAVGEDMPQAVRPG